jgi:spore maturation protein CgeB
VRWVVAQPGPSFSVQDVYAGWVEALQNLGQKVIEYNLDDRITFYGSVFRRTGEHTFKQALTPEQSYELAINGLYATLYKARPDILLVVSGFFIAPDLLDRVRRSGTRIVIIHTETPYENERQLKLAPYADLNLVDDMVSVEEFSRVAPAMYKPHAYRPSIHRPGAGIPDLECDFAFVGTGYPSRVAFLEAMDFTDLDVLLAGNWQTINDESPLYPFLAHEPDECLDNDKTADVYRSAKTSLNLYRREAQAPELVAGTAMGPRELEMAACGLFFLRDRRPEGDEVLGMLPTFDSPGEASELLRWFLAHPDERQALADKAREAIADRTFDAQAQQLLRLLDQ